MVSKKLGNTRRESIFHFHHQLLHYFHLEKQIKEVQESRNKIARETHMDTVDAAGIRRKLPVHYHCISCNRPVDVPFRDSEPCLPESEGLPLRKMKIPYTSYEIEQV